MRLNGIEVGDYTSTFREVALRFHTPSFVFDVDCFRSRLRNFRQLVRAKFDAKGISTSVSYAAKAFLCTELVGILADEGLNIDCCSLLEAKTALRGSMRGGQIGLHGNNKSDAELKLALENDFHAVFIDSLDEIVRVEDIAKALDKTANIILRLTTGVHAGGHEFISTAHEDQKFGLSVSSTSGADSVALQAVEQVLACEHLKLQGVHSHIGSQIASPDGFLASAEKLLEFRLHVKSRFGVLLETLDLGGGFGIQYLDTDPELDLTQLFESLQGLISEHSKANQLPLPSLVFEPGRWVIGPCMFMVYTVGTIKDVEYSAGMFRRYVSVDGGMADNIRPMLYGAKYSCYALTFEPSDDTTACRVVGKHCESGDILIDDVQLPKSLKRNDLLVIPSVGAYSYSMSSNYNMLPKPAVIALENGRVREMIKRQDESEIIR